MSSYSAKRSSLKKAAHPRGQLPSEARPRAVVKTCSHCRNNFALKRWDSWNGFIIRCPHCEGLQGRSWNIKQVLFASFLFNAVSFLFTMRPQKAFAALLGYVLIGFGGNYVLDHYQIPDLAAVLCVALFILAPLCINAVILIQHERELDSSIHHRATLSSSVYNPGRTA